MEWLSLVLEGKDIGLVGPRLAEPDVCTKGI